MDENARIIENEQQKIKESRNEVIKDFKIKLQNEKNLYCELEDAKIKINELEL